MDRQIFYSGQLVPETALLNMAKDAMMGLAKLSSGVLGTGTVVSGFNCTPTIVPSLSVLVSGGEIYSLQNVDNSNYSRVLADTAHKIVKQGVLLDGVTLPLIAPTTAGQSVNYLVQVSFLEVDTAPLLLPYYNSANPSQTLSGALNSGVPDATIRTSTAAISLKAGNAAITGSQVTPTADVGYTGIFVVTLNNGQTTIAASNIARLPDAPFVSETLTQKLGQSSAQITALAGGTADALTVAFTPAFTAIANQTILVRAAFANATSTPTIAVNGIGAIAIVKGNNLPLAATDIAGAGHWLELTLDATLNKAVLQNPASGINGFSSIAEAQAFLATNKQLSPATLAAAFKGSNQSLAANGYQKLPGGLILQWGASVPVTTNTPVIYPVAFPTAMLWLGSQDSSGQPNLSLWSYTPAGLSGFTAYNIATIQKASTTVNASIAASFLWLAIGY